MLAIKLTEATMEVWAYAKGENRNFGDDVQAQRSAIHAYGKKHGFKVGSIGVDDEEFGPLYDRDAGGGVFKGAKAGDVIIAARFDVLFSTPADALHVVVDLQSRGVALHIVDIGGEMTPHMFILFARMAVAFIKGEGRAASERVRRRVADAKSRGRYTGGSAPFGWRKGDDGALVPHDGEQDAIAEIIAMHVVSRPLRGIAAAMAAKGHKISHEGVAGVLRSHMDETNKLIKMWPCGEEKRFQDLFEGELWGERWGELVALARDIVGRSLKRRAKLSGSQPG